MSVGIDRLLAEVKVLSEKEEAALMQVILELKNGNGMGGQSRRK